MSASSSAASSSLSRPRGAILVVAALVCAYGSYYLWSTATEENEFISTSAAQTLHRSNAVHRRRRRTNPDNPVAEGQTDGADDGQDQPLVELVPHTLTDGETVVDDAAATENWEWNQPLPYERNGQNIVQLLFRVSEDATRRNAYVHRGCECNSCGQVPIRGIRYHCANCADYDLCEGCESQGLHTKTHIFYKIRVPAPSFGPILSMPVAYSGDPDNVELKMLSKELTTKLSRETGFERPELDAYWEQWTFMANTEWREDPDEIGLAMDRKTFEHCLIPSGGYRQPAPGLIYDRMFAFYDTNHDDLISFPEFLHGIAFRKKKDKWIKIFQGYDVDGDGYVDRKDFLRLWRSYYALFRQMHRDMLSGMQEQQMITSQAHQLVNGRQPLSSIFGSAEMRPRGVDIRAGEGKSIQPNGELEITDGKGIMSSSGNDTATREEIFRSNNASAAFWNRDRSATAYWETMLNPPRNLDQLGETVRQLEGARNIVREVLQEDLIRRRGADDDSSEYDSEADSISDPERDHSWMPIDLELTDEDAEAVDGPGTRLVDVQRTSRRAVIAHALARERTEKELHERWKRRQFYTDEEEGAQPPSDWKDEEDILVNGTSVGESSKAPSRPFRSRSSSKVRFAEDMDDFDTRSNPSTSSRSVPERWGGFEIPEAERDAGKEILFQVTQQAFNELLDPLFKELEDTAVKAAEQKSRLEKYRPQFEAPEFHKWATWESNRLKAEKERKEKEKKESTPPPPPVEDNRPFWPTLNVVDLPEVRERPLQELLEATGYEIMATENGIPFSLDEETPPREALDEIRVESTVNLLIEDESLGPLSRSPVNRSQIDISALQNTFPELQDLASPPIEAALLSSPISPEAEPSPSLEATLEIYRDPTMPQFRPDTLPTITSYLSSSTSIPSSESDQKENTSPSPVENEDDGEKEKGPSQAKLFDLWNLNEDIKEADRRGGWGRLNYAEFHAKVRKGGKEGRGNQMDYLGSWLDFCIP
jgi:Ca2+-binding EF-hand superfamily protein